MLTKKIIYANIPQGGAYGFWMPNLLIKWHKFDCKLKMAHKGH